MSGDYANWLKAAQEARELEARCAPSPAATVPPVGGGAK